MVAHHGTKIFVRRFVLTATKIFGHRAHKARRSGLYAVVNKCKVSLKNFIFHRAGGYLMAKLSHERTYFILMPLITIGKLH